MEGNFVLIAIWILISLISMKTDIQRHEIDHWPLLVGIISTIALILLNKVDREVYSWNFNLVNLNITVSLLSALAIFVIFLLIPVGGGDMKFLAAISLYLGFYETLFFFGIGCIFTTIYTFATNKKYKETHTELFEKATTKSKQRKILNKREIPLMIGVAPAMVIGLVAQLF